MVPFCKIVTSQPECVLICAGVNIKFYTPFLIWVIPLLPQSRHWSPPTPQGTERHHPRQQPYASTLGNQRGVSISEMLSFQKCYTSGTVLYDELSSFSTTPGSSRVSCIYQQLSPFYCQVVFHVTATSVCLTLHPDLLIQKEGSSAPSLSVKNRTYFSKLILYAHAVKFIAQQKCTEWKVGLTSIPYPSPQPHPVSVCASYD